MKRSVGLFFCLALISAVSFSQSSAICNCLIPLDSTFQYVPMTQGPDAGIPPYYRNNDAATPPIKLPFTFCFYGQSFDTVYISNNGIISFKKPVYSFADHGFPLGADTLLIAPFYSDIDTRGILAGQVLYKITPSCMIVEWDSVGYATLDDDIYNSFQLIITNGADPIVPEGNNVSFCYTNMQWASADASGGFQGFDGMPATVGINNGDKNDYAQFSTFDLPGAYFNGPFNSSNGLYWLDSSSFAFNTCFTGNNVPPVIVNNQQSCDTTAMCAGSAITVTASFLCPENGQTCTLAASCPGISDVSVTDTGTVNDISSVTVQLTTSASDTGIHILNITATDNSIPAQISYLPVAVVVSKCLGIEEVILNGDFRVYPNPCNGSFTVETDNNKQSPLNDEVKVYDILGNNIYSVKLNNAETQINVSGKSKGVYFLKLYAGEMPLGVKKIIIQ